MTLELQKPDDPPPAQDQPPALAVVERVEEIRDGVCRRYIDSLVVEDRKPELPFETQRRTLTRGQDDLLAAERLARERLKQAPQ